ncbi:hypothetical protein [Rufibacter sp. XAAS-G3-1]|uniref:hypothetical protein n=1 Tax=Rufibacter sp. XAAS-G3-1 TaxID=2729134 RepID=UPI0015E6C277|nr:hypothetical protein [Rufibacter sp. XAAS-G3-1]
MKNILPFLFLLLSLLVFSCNEEEEERLPPQLRLSKTTIYLDSRAEPFMTHTFAYNGKGLLTDFDRIRHFYDKNGRLTSAADDGVSETFTYDAAGKLTGATRRFPLNPDRPADIATFEHDAQGRITRVNGEGGGATLLTYDAAGNVIRQEGYYTSLYTGELGFRSYLIEVTYDTKRNPLQGIGSPIGIYSSPTRFTNAGSWNFISYLSPNNPTELRTTNFDNSVGGSAREEVIPLVYTYNAEGLPTEIHYDGFWQKLEYAML